MSKELNALILPTVRNLRASIFRIDDAWVVLLADKVYDNVRAPKYVDRQHFDFLYEAQAWAMISTGQPGVVRM